VLAQEVQRSRRYGRSLAIVSVDCNRFKDFNTARGHSTGDLLLQALADVLVRKFRSTDLVTRTGDDEFMIVLPETGPEPMGAMLASLQAQIKQVMQLRGWAMTCSVVGSVYERPPADVGKIYEQQAELLAQAKLHPNDGPMLHQWPADDVPEKSSILMEIA
jgi:diguanylate cyclase (GGDEF)-like protein